MSARWPERTQSCSEAEGKRKQNKKEESLASMDQNIRVHLLVLGSRLVSLSSPLKKRICRPAPQC